MTEQENLELQIRTYDSNYRAGTPICTDEVYDKLVEELAEKFPDSTLLKKGVIEQKQKESRKQKLPIYMGSLNKCKSIEEIRQWLKSNNIPEDELLVITPKYDGISLVVSEESGACWTRGDGEEGQISDKHFGYTNSKVLGEDFYSFGEAIMSKKNFDKHKEKYANARNMVAGLFNRDEPVEELRDVDYIRYGSDQDNLDKVEQLNALNELNSIDVPYYCVHIENIGEKMMNLIYKEWSKDYQIDGLVIDINSSTLRQELGREENMNPKYARAYKNPDWSGTAEVRVTGITWQVSKQGKLKPVINIEPTEVSGITIENVTGYNAAYIADNNIAEDSIIKIVRSGDVIPKHIETLSYNKDKVQELFDEVSLCSCCGEQTRWDETMTELICTNPECEEKQIAKLVHFFSTMEVEDFGEPSIKSFFLAGFKTLEAILNMSQMDIIKIDGFGSKTSIKLLSQFNKIKKGVPFAKLLHALDLFDGKIGEKTIQLIFDNVEWKDIKNIEKLIEIDGIATIMANVFLEGMNRWWNSGFELNHKMPIVKYIKTPQVQVTEDTYKDMKVCFTGCRPTKEQLDNLIKGGGIMVSGVSKNTTHLVVKNMSDTVLSSSKSKKAKQLGVEIVEIKKFFI